MVEQQRLHAFVHGRVQMVGFRYFVVRQAEALDLTGWVRNGDDGRSVEVVAEGPEDRLHQLEASLHEGPRASRVEGVDSDWSGALEGHQTFEVRW